MPKYLIKGLENDQSFFVTSDNCGYFKNKSTIVDWINNAI